MRGALRRTQQGAVLFIALIVLVAMSLAGVALLRGVDTGTIIAGNLAFRQTSTHVADLGVEAAREWIRTKALADLYTDISVDAYYATWQADIDLLHNDPGKTDFDWSGAKSVTAAPFVPPLGYELAYVIHRLCDGFGAPSSTACVKVTGASGGTSGGTKGAVAYGAYAITVPNSAMYRVTVRVTGPRNTRSFVQATVY